MNTKTVRTLLYSLAPLAGLTLVGAGCVDPLFNSTNETVPIVTTNTAAPVVDYSEEATATAQALLTVANVWSIDAFDELAMPSLAEFNDHLENTRSDAYTYYVAQAWYDSTKEDSIQIDNAINVYNSVADAKAGLEKLSSGLAEITGSGAIGDAMHVLYQSSGDGVPAAVIYRYQIDRYAAKVAVYETDSTPAFDADVQAELEPQAYALAVAQAERLQQLVDGTLDEPILYQEVYDLLPATLSGTTPLGSSPVTATEWLTIERNFSGVFNGFDSAALRRFQVNDRPDEVVEVVIFKMLNKEYADGFISDLVGKADDEYLLPYFLVDSSKAKYLPGGYGIELQGQYKNYIVDVTIMAPFGAFDSEAAGADLETMSDEVLTHIRENAQ